MLNESGSKITLKDVILRILFVVFCLFILVWLFPTKEYMANYIDGAFDKKINEKLDPLYSNFFNQNISDMKEAAKSYFTDNNLPQNVGDTKKVTLGEMVDKKFLLSLNDSNGESCDLKKSYAEITKKDNGYEMKVNLSCPENEDHILVPMGSYNYCDTEICEKKKTVASNESANETTNVEVGNTSSTKCEYAKVINGKWGSYGPWSNWTTSKINKTNNNVVESKTVKTYAGTKTVTDKKVQTKASDKQYKTMYVCKDANGNEKTYASSSSCINSKPVSKKVAYYTCPKGYDNEGSYIRPTTCKKTSTVSRKVNQYKDVTYYRQKTRAYISGNKSIKWSSCNDSKLINNGYYKTGKTK